MEAADEFQEVSRAILPSQVGGRGSMKARIRFASFVPISTTSFRK
jgi:hypothetical protein